MKDPVTLFHNYLAFIGMGDYIYETQNTTGDGRTCSIKFLDSATEEYKQEIFKLRDAYNWEEPDFWTKIPQKTSLVDKFQNFFKK